MPYHASCADDIKDRIKKALCCVPEREKEIENKKRQQQYPLPGAVEKGGNPDLIKWGKVAEGVTCNGENDGKNPCKEVDLAEKKKRHGIRNPKKEYCRDCVYREE